MKKRGIGRQIIFVIIGALMINTTVMASEQEDAELTIQNIIQEDIIKNSTKQESSDQILGKLVAYSTDKKMAFFEKENVSKMAEVDNKVLCKNESIMTFASTNGYNSRFDYVPGGSVKVSHYYTLDESNNHFQMLKSTFTYNVDESKYRFINVKAGYGLKGFKVNGGEYNVPLTYRSFGDKLIGTKTEVIQVNSPILKYHTSPLRFEIASATSFTVKDMTNGTQWNKSFGIYSIN